MAARGGYAKTLADAAVTAALVPIYADQFVAVGAPALSTLKAEKDDRDYDDSSSSSCRRWVIVPSARGIEVMKRNTEAVAKAVSK